MASRTCRAIWTNFSITTLERNNASLPLVLEPRAGEAHGGRAPAAGRGSRTAGTNPGEGAPQAGRDPGGYNAVLARSRHEGGRRPRTGALVLDHRPAQRKDAGLRRGPEAHRRDHEDTERGRPGGHEPRRPLPRRLTRLGRPAHAEQHLQQHVPDRADAGSRDDRRRDDARRAHRPASARRTGQQPFRNGWATASATGMATPWLW